MVYSPWDKPVLPAAFSRIIAKVYEKGHHDSFADSREMPGLIPSIGAGEPLVGSVTAITAR